MASTSDAAIFYTTFQALKADATDALSRSAADAAPKLAALKDALVEARATLPPYDQRSYDLQLRELETRLSGLRAEKPKSRFAFKRPPSASTSASASTAPSAPVSRGVSASPAPPPPPVARTPTEPATTYTLAGQRHTQLTVADFAPPSGCTYTLTLSDLEDCVVDLRPHPSSATSPAGTDAVLTSLHARGLRNCVVLAPLMSGSAMLSDVLGSVVALGAQQFRLHSSSDSVLLLHVASLPVIEHCERVRFGVYSFPCTGASRHEEVQDFDWVRSGPSPHWSLLPSDLATKISDTLKAPDTPPASTLLACI